MAFYEKAFGAKKSFEALADDGKRILNAQLAVFGTNLLGDALRDILDPRQRG